MLCDVAGTSSQLGMERTLPFVSADGDLIGWMLVGRSQVVGCPGFPSRLLALGVSGSFLLASGLWPWSR